jgi:hypothetical protein
LSGAHELGLSTSLALLVGELVLATETETSGARDLGLSTSLALLAGELVLATETETHFLLETGICFPLGLETNTRFPLETGIRFQLRLETNTCFPLVLNVLFLSALLSAPFVLSPTLALALALAPLPLRVEAGGRGRSWCHLFFLVCCCCVLCVLLAYLPIWYSTKYRMIPRRWSLGLSTVQTLQRIFFCHWFLDVDKLSHVSTEKMTTYPMYHEK